MTSCKFLVSAFIIVPVALVYIIILFYENSDQLLSVLITAEKINQISAEKEDGLKVRNWFENTQPGLTAEDLALSKLYDEEEKYKCDEFKKMKNSPPNYSCKAIDKCKRFPSFLIIGAMKSGTYALKMFLRLHPSLENSVSPPEPGLGIFSRGTKPGYKEWNKYHEMMPRAENSKLVFQKSTLFLPKYGIVTNAPRWMHMFNSSIKMVVILKDPVDRLLSLHAHLRRQNRKYINSSFTKEVLNENGSIREESFLFNQSNYLHALKRWFCYFPKEQFLFLDGEKMTKDPAAILQQVEKFLGIDPYFKQSMFYIPAYKGFPCLKESHHCMPKRKGIAHDKITEETKLKLMKYMKPMIVEMFKLGNFSFDWETMKV